MSCCTLNGHSHVAPEGEEFGQSAELLVLAVARQHLDRHVDTHAAVVHAADDDAAKEIVSVEKGDKHLHGRVDGAAGGGDVARDDAE